MERFPILLLKNIIYNLTLNHNLYNFNSVLLIPSILTLCSVLAEGNYLQHSKANTMLIFIISTCNYCYDLEANK